MKYFAYILHAISADKYYIGSSIDPERRIKFHNSIEKGFTSRYRPWQLVFQKEFPGKTEAQQFERKVKRWKSKLMIKRLVNGDIQL